MGARGLGGAHACLQASCPFQSSWFDTGNFIFLCHLRLSSILCIALEAFLPEFHDTTGGQYLYPQEEEPALRSKDPGRMACDMHSSAKSAHNRVFMLAGLSSQLT